jgi:hypothetical protein
MFNVHESQGQGYMFFDEMFLSNQGFVSIILLKTCV